MVPKLLHTPSMGPRKNVGREGSRPTTRWGGKGALPRLLCPQFPAVVPFPAAVQAPAWNSSPQLLEERRSKKFGDHWFTELYPICIKQSENKTLLGKVFQCDAQIENGALGVDIS